MLFVEYLVKNNLLTSEIVQEILFETQKNKLSFIENLIQNEAILNGKILAKTLAQYFALPFIDLDNHKITDFKIEPLSLTLIKKYRVLSLGVNNNKLQLIIANPTNDSAINAIKFHTNSEINLLIAEHNKIIKIIETITTENQYCELELIKEKNNNINYAHSIANNENTIDDNDTPIIKFVDQILNDALTKNASDIHFEPYEKLFRIRFRIDGILYEITKIDISLAERFTSRIKIMAKLNIAEKRLPQDGRFTLSVKNNLNRDCRISTCPTLFGEKIVIRILNPNNISLKIDQLGFDQIQQQIFSESIGAPQGMILVTGPTGSGKTVTLYTALNALNVTSKNISTIEDPIEINLLGINQVEVNHKINLDFPNALRAFLRQDPDIMMIGEIRDFETAEIAIKAAQTGHMVLSTLHTNNASATITRLINMGIATYNIASSISLIIAQRLVRRLCDNCKQEKHLPQKALIEAGFNLPHINNNCIFTPTGCNKCKQGYLGRIGIFEFLPITKNISDAILQHNNNFSCSSTLREQALNKVTLGLTSLEEINRAIL
jgi:type IV pilus assembly protein PilB